MSDTNSGGPAFPSAFTGQDEGMSLRDYFAAKAMQGLLSDTNVLGTPDEFASRAWAMADAMLKAKAA